MFWDTDEDRTIKNFWVKGKRSWFLYDFMVDKGINRCFEVKDTCWETVHKVDCCSNCFWPKRCGNLGFDEKGPSNLEYVPILSFRYPILFRCVATRSLVDKPFFSKEGFHVCIDVFPPVI